MENKSEVNTFIQLNENEYEIRLFILMQTVRSLQQKIMFESTMFGTDKQENVKRTINVLINDELRIAERIELMMDMFVYESFDYRRTSEDFNSWFEEWESYIGNMSEIEWRVLENRINANDNLSDITPRPKGKPLKMTSVAIPASEALKLKYQVV